MMILGECYDFYIVLFFIKIYWGMWKIKHLGLFWEALDINFFSISRIVFSLRSSELKKTYILSFNPTLNNWHWKQKLIQSYMLSKQWEQAICDRKTRNL